MLGKTSLAAVAVTANFILPFNLTSSNLSSSAYKGRSFFRNRNYLPEVVGTAEVVVVDCSRVVVFGGATFTKTVVVAAVVVVDGLVVVVDGLVVVVLVVVLVVLAVIGGLWGLVEDTGTSMNGSTGSGSLQQLPA